MKTVKIKDIAQVEMGLSPKGESYNFDGNGLPLLNGPTEFGTIYPNCTLYTTDSKRESEVNDLIFCVRGSTTGKMNFSDKKYSLGRGVCAIRGKNYIVTKYIKYALDKYLKSLLQFANGGTFSNLCRDDILNFEIPFNNHEKVVKFLSNYDDLIENNNRRIKILEEMAQKIYKEWFVDFKFPGHETATFKDSPLGKIPKDWNYKPIGNLLEHQIGGGWGEAKINNKYTEKAFVIRGTDIPNARLGNIQDCPLRYHTPSNIKTRLLKVNDIVFEVSGGSKGQPVGRTLFLNKNLFNQFKENVICASFCKLLRVDSEQIIPEYVYLHLLNIYDNGEIEKYQTQSTGIINFKFTFFIENEKILIPTQDIINKFKNVIVPIYNEIFLLGNKNQILKQTRDILLPRLISGEIDVENMEIL